MNNQESTARFFKRAAPIPWKLDREMSGDQRIDLVAAHPFTRKGFRTASASERR
jgi:hypothetical protein